MKYSFFYIPFTYNIVTRLISTKKIISWVIIYILPTLYIFLHYSEINVETLWTYFLGVSLIYNFYEVGYIQNDAETIKKESKPTMRLSRDQLDYYESNKYKIYLYRFILGNVLLYFLFLLNQKDNLKGFALFLISSFFILILYQVYNRIRNIYNLVLHFLLVCIRFLSIIIIAKNKVPFVEFLFLLFVFPVSNLIERGSDLRFNVKLFTKIIPNEKYIAKSRVTFYFVVFLLGLFLNYFFNLECEWILKIYIIAFVYRVSNLFIEK
jgi:hypothetical protein